MPNTSHSARVLQILSLAEQGLDQSAIARRVKCGQPYVSRVLVRARQSGLLVTTTVLRRDMLSPEEQAYLSGVKAPANLASLLNNLAQDGGKRLKGVRVFTSVPDLSSSRSQLLPSLQAARIIHELLEPAQRIGVAWGRTLAAIVRSLSDLGRPSRGTRKQFFPLRGDPMGRTSSDVSASFLVERLHAWFECRGAPSSLQGVPALVPYPLADTYRHIEKLASFSPTFRRIYLGEPPGSTPEIERLDAIVTACGAITEGISPITSALLDLLQLNDIAKWSVLGDVAGCLIPHPNARAADVRRIERCNDLWIGLKTSHLRGCATRAVDEKTPGVILIASGHRQKARLALEAVRAGLVSWLLIDHICAEHLAKLVDEALPK